MPRTAFEIAVHAARPHAFGILSDHEGLAASLPGRFVAVRARSRRGCVSVLEERMRVGGAELLMTVRHTFEPPAAHEMAVLGGDARGSRIAEAYAEAPAAGGAGGSARLTLLRVEADVRPGLMGAAAAALGIGRARRVLGGLEPVYREMAALAEGPGGNSTNGNGSSNR